ncbi:MAG: HAMP domain-containing protein [Thermodesulfobacteriota bacterium]|jgi:HAMP domain-containing protein
MTLQTKSVGLVALIFFLVLGASYALFGSLRGEVISGLGSVYAEKQVLYNRERTLHPLMRELALAQKLADSSTLKAWAAAEDDPTLRAAALRELEDYRRFFSDGSYFFALHGSGNYYFNDRENRYAGSELRYTLDPADPEDRWYFGTVESGEPYRLNVDFDEKLQVTKVWINVVVRGADGPLGIVGTGIDLTDFLSAVVSSDGQPGVTTLFMEGGGAIQAHDRVELIDFRTISKSPGETKTVFQLLDEERDRAGLRAAMDRLRTAPDGEVEVITAALGGGGHLIGLTYLSEIGWFNVTFLDTEQMLGDGRFVPLALLLLGALLVLSGALTVTLKRLVLDRVARLELSMGEVARGAMPALSAPPTAGAGDEMGRLEEGFRRMAEAVREHTELLEGKVQTRTRELARQNEALRQALTQIRSLKGLLPTCMYCKKIRDGEGRWNRMEEYISERTEARFSHGICPECLHKPYEDDPAARSCAP